MKILNIKDQFPFFKNNPDIIYLDSAATTQKPKIVLKALSDFYYKNNTNVHRSSYPLASKLAKEIEKVREKVKKFINAKEKEEIIFTFGATDGFNKIIYSIGLNYLKDGDEILYCPLDHKSFILPWFKVKELLEKENKIIKLIPFKINKAGSVDKKDLFSKITDKTRVINITHIHNVYGVDTDISKIKNYLDKANKKNIIINVDATQSIGHRLVDVQKLGVDILSFSGHKMFAIQGIGVTFINKKLHSIIKPIFVGGGNGAKLENDKVKIINFSQVYESGTQNYAGILTLGKAIDFIEKIGINKIHLYLADLTQYLIKELRKLPKIEFIHGPLFCSCTDGNGILSFKITNLPANEVGFILSENNILVRTGNHCISNPDNVDDVIRVSMHIYNTKEDIDKLIHVIKKLVF